MARGTACSLVIDAGKQLQLASPRCSTWMEKRTQPSDVRSWRTQLPFLVLDASFSGRDPSELTAPNFSDARHELMEASLDATTPRGWRGVSRSRRSGTAGREARTPCWMAQQLFPEHLLHINCIQNPWMDESTTVRERDHVCIESHASDRPSTND